MKSDMLNLKVVNYNKCRLCDCGCKLDGGTELEFITENKQTVNQFICDSCLDTIINSPKAEEWY